MGMVFDLIHSLTDMKELSKYQDAIEKEITELEKSGKLPAELKTAYETLKNSKSTGGSTEDSMIPLQEFAKVLEKYEDLFPDSIKKIVGKFEGVTNDLEGIAERVDKMSKK